MVYSRPSEDYPTYWNKMRWAIFKYYNYHCQMCGRYAKGNLQLHHKVPVRISHNNNSQNLIPICRQCHEMIHQDYLDRKRRFENVI